MPAALLRAWPRPLLQPSSGQRSGSVLSLNATPQFSGAALEATPWNPLLQEAQLWTPALLPASWVKWTQSSAWSSALACGTFMLSCVGNFLEKSLYALQLSW